MLGLTASKVTLSNENLTWTRWSTAWLLSCSVKKKTLGNVILGPVRSHDIATRAIKWVQFSHWVMSDSLWPHGLQHARLPHPSPTPRACSNSCPLSWWWHPTISSLVIPFSFCLQSFPPSQSFSRVNSSYQVAKILELQLKHQSFQ